MQDAIREGNNKTTTLVVSFVRYHQKITDDFSRARSTINRFNLLYRRMDVADSGVYTLRFESVEMVDSPRMTFRDSPFVLETSSSRRFIATGYSVVHPVTDRRLRISLSSTASEEKSGCILYFLKISTSTPEMTVSLVSQYLSGVSGWS